MPEHKLTGRDYTTPDLVAKVTGRARYAEDFRVDGMLFCKLLLSPMPHARVTGIDTSAALAMTGVKAILTAGDLPPRHSQGPSAPSRASRCMSASRFWPLPRSTN
jgi:CO/xanthine dehydrogenase Mo-binding subunit